MREQSRKPLNLNHLIIMPTAFTTPLARLVWGSVHTPQVRKDQNGQPKLFVSGDRAGQPLRMFDFGVAIPKTQARWQDEPGWGQIIYQTGLQCWPQGQHQRTDFSWKITDGDSTIPNKNNRRPCDQEGYRGCWVLTFSGAGAPQIFSTLKGGKAEIDATPELIKPGYKVQVFGEVDTNNSSQTSGMYLNHRGVCMRGYDTEIITQAPVDTSGFGSGVAEGSHAMPTNVAIPGAAPAPQPPAAPTPPAPAPAAPAVPVVPNANYAPSAPARERMVHKDGQSLTYAAMRAQNWTDALMAQHGYTIDPA